MPLSGRLQVVLQRGVPVGCNAQALFQHQPQVVARVGVAVLGRVDPALAVLPAFGRRNPAFRGTAAPGLRPCALHVFHRHLRSNMVLGSCLAIPLHGFFGFRAAVATRRQQFSQRMLPSGQTFDRSLGQPFFGCQCVGHHPLPRKQRLAQRQLRFGQTRLRALAVQRCRLLRVGTGEQTPHAKHGLGVTLLAGATQP